MFVEFRLKTRTNGRTHFWLFGMYHFQLDTQSSILDFNVWKYHEYKVKRSSSHSSIVPHYDMASVMPEATSSAPSTASKSAYVLHEDKEGRAQKPQ